MHISAQNAALIVRRLSSDDFVQFEVFEVSPQNHAIMSTKGKLLCSYPGPAIQVPADVFMDECFRQELSSFLIQMDVDCFDSTPTTSKAGSVVKEVRETVHPKYISELLVGILRGYGRPADVDRITKRIGEEVLWNNAYKPWRRSPLWLTLRVSLQSSLGASGLYKPFMLFFHTHLLRCCVDRDFPSGSLYAMRVKTARRLSKLDPAISGHVYEFAHNTFKETEMLLSKRWTEFQAKGSITPTSQSEGLDFIADRGISLENSYNYLEKMIRFTPDNLPQMRFTPSQKPRLNNIHCFTQFINGRLASAIAKDKRVAITDFESTVERELESWVVKYANNDDAPDVIASCIQQYYKGAEEHYGTNAEGSSMMVLTIMDLWVALDMSTIRQCPLLKEYSPEIPPGFLQSILLHRSSTLKRALRIEEYLCRRHKEVPSGPSHKICNSRSIFLNSDSETSFAVKYFCASKHLQRIYDNITASAEEERASKREELVSLNEEYSSLMSKASNTDHECSVDDLEDGTLIKNCQKCQLERRANALKIQVHEWPLPETLCKAQQTVFELSPPRAFSAWRDITYLILRDIGLSSDPDLQGEPQVQVLLGSFSGLDHWAMPRLDDNRVTIGSTTKSFSDSSHYKQIKIPAEESSVLVNNGLSFKLFDCVRKSWAKCSFSASNASELCTPPIPSTSPYNLLHRFVSNTQHTSNDIIASQADCPEEITLHEFLAFAGLRSGPRLQWLNIARELASPYLSFRREEVHTLITQAAWQLGPLSDGVREWHVDLNIPGFGNILLRELESLLEKIGANWLEEVTVRTIGASLADIISYPNSCLMSHQPLSPTVFWPQQKNSISLGGHVHCCGRLEI